jgi:tetratricopeptide (TPR) repeat protein
MPISLRACGQSTRQRRRLHSLSPRQFLRVAIASGVLFSAVPALAQEPATEPATQNDLIPKSFDGEEDFEEASRLRLKVDSLDTLKELIGLAESAIKKGLDAADMEAAKKLVASSYIQKTELMIGMLNGSQQLSRARIEKLLKEFVTDLEQAIEYNPKLVDAYLIKTELHARRTEKDLAFETANSGIEALLPDAKQSDPESKEKLSRLIMMRAGLRTDPAEQLDDLKLSIQTNPSNVASITLYRANAMQQSKTAEAIEFLKSMVEQHPENELLACSTAELMAITPESIPDAIKLLTDKLSAMPNSVEMLKSRAKIYSVNKEADLAKADMDKVVELASADIEGLLLRAQVLLDDDKLDEARKDVDAAYDLDNNRVGTILLRAAIASAQKRYGDAISDYQLILKNTPKGQEKNPRLLMQLALLYSQDNRPTQAIKIFDQVIKTNQDYWEAYRLRGDTRLGLGDHENAIKDFESALELAPEAEEDRSGILNNLSWVLSTTPNDALRDGKRALEYAIEACKLTDYKAPHILSTLAAAHAEVGEFDQAVEWSQKGVELARETNAAQLEQLENELKSYQEKKPWREKTETKENKAPIGLGNTGVDS